MNAHVTEYCNVIAPRTAQVALKGGTGKWEMRNEEMETRNGLVVRCHRPHCCRFLVPCRNADPGTEGERLATDYENVLKLVCALSELRACADCLKN